MRAHYSIISFLAVLILVPPAFAEILYEEETRNPASQNVEPVTQKETIPFVKQPASTKPSACTKLKQDVTRTPQWQQSDRQNLTNLIEKLSSNEQRTCLTKATPNRMGNWTIHIICDGEELDTISSIGEEDRDKLISNLATVLANQGIRLIGCNTINIRGNINIYCSHQK